MGPVLEQPPLAEQPRDGVRRVGADARPSAIRWLRSTVEIESSCTHESRRIALSTSAIVPRRERAAYPWASIAIRRSAVRETSIARFYPRTTDAGGTLMDVRRFLAVCAVGSWPPGVSAGCSS